MSKTVKVICGNVNGYCTVCESKIPFGEAVCEGPRHHVVENEYFIPSVGKKERTRKKEFCLN